MKAIEASKAPEKKKKSNYPEPFKSLMDGRTKRPLGDLFGLQNFGVNLTEIQPGGQSSLYHAHSKQDEFIYVLEGCPTLHVGNEKIELSPGMCAGFVHGGDAHQLVNNSKERVVYLEIGDRSLGDVGSYPNDDLVAKQDANGAWVFTRKDGTPYPRD